VCCTLATQWYLVEGLYIGCLGPSLNSGLLGVRVYRGVRAPGHFGDYVGVCQHRDEKRGDEGVSDSLFSLLLFYWFLCANLIYTDSRHSY